MAVVAATSFSAACTDAKAPENVRSKEADRWFKRAERDFNDVKVEDAHDAIERALAMAPKDPEIRLLGGKIALVRLEFDESLRLLNDLPGTEAHALRGRAYWFRGQVSPAADEFEAMLNDPDVRDDWAKSIAGLARRGEGREPFTISGQPRAIVELAHTTDAAPYLVVPVEIDGEDRLAVVATGIPEMVVDSAAFAEPSWISMRFKTRRMGVPDLEPGGYLEVNDVPALTQDLSGISKEVNAPITALIGVSVLRRLNATVDYGGHQFVVRKEEAPPPHSATKVPLYYAKGGGMVMNTSFGANDDSRATLFVDSMQRFPIALDDRGWVKAGLVPADLAAVQGDTSQKLKGGNVPTLKLGAFRIDQVPGVLGSNIADIERTLRIDVDGVVGSPVLAMYRITFSDGGRAMYLEDDTELQQILQTMGGGGGPVDVPGPTGPSPNPGPIPTGPIPTGPVPPGPVPPGPVPPGPIQPGNTK